MIRKFCVYEHIFPNQKRYIGITCQKPEVRWDYGWGYKEDIQPTMYRAIQKYGWKNIKHNILFVGLSLEEAHKKEKELIQKYHTCILDPLCAGYNMTYGGEGFLKYTTTEEKEEAERQRKKEYGEKYREKHNERQKQYYQKNKEKLLKRDKEKRDAWRKDHPLPPKQTREEALRKKREAEALRKARMTPEEKELLKQKKREYYLKNREEILAKNKRRYWEQREAKGE